MSRYDSIMRLYFWFSHKLKFRIMKTSPHNAAWDQKIPTGTVEFV